MKQIKLLLLSFFLLSFGYSNGQVELRKSKITIAGKIENPTNRTLSIINRELVGRKQHSIKISEDGSFHAIFHVLSLHDSYLQYNNQLVTVFLEPNDSLYLTADGENFKQTIQFSGDNASSNYGLQKFFNEFRSLISSDDLYKITVNSNPIEFKKYVTNFFKKLDAKVEMIGREQQLNDKIIKWMEAYSKYKLGEELFDYGKKSKEALPENYYDFAEVYSNAQELNDFYCSQYYNDFVNDYFTYKFSKHKKREIISKHFRNGNNYAALKTMFDMISEQESVNPAIELYLTRTYYQFLGRVDNKSADSLFSSYSKIVTNKSFKNFIKQEINERRFSDNDYTLDDLASLEFVGEIFSDIKEKHQGKVLYIDLWGTWCKPCLKEFPYSRVLHDELRNEDVALVYLGVRSKKEDWQKTINKYDLAGTHYLLNADQYNVLAAEFISTGFPQYMIINKEGIIVNRNASRPSQKITKAKLTSLANE